jgi:monoamine oxidase
MQLFGVPVEFILFALTLVGVALLHHYTLYVALAGLAVGYVACTRTASALPIGAVWDGNEEQRGRSGILSLLAGGGASDATQALTAKVGARGLLDSLEWLGVRDTPLLASRQIVWEQDPFARGGYAFFDPSFDPARRAWLARPSGRLFFAGEHTSMRWQGYMNGAVESGRRAALEIAAAVQLGTPAS